MNPRKRLLDHINFLSDSALVLAIVCVTGIFLSLVGFCAGYLVRVEREQKIWKEGYDAGVAEQMDWSQLKGRTE